MVQFQEYDDEFPDTNSSDVKAQYSYPYSEASGEYGSYYDHSYETVSSGFVQGTPQSKAYEPMENRTRGGDSSGSYYTSQASSVQENQVNPSKYQRYSYETDSMPESVSTPHRSSAPAPKTGDKNDVTRSLDRSHAPMLPPDVPSGLDPKEEITQLRRQNIELRNACKSSHDEIQSHLSNVMRLEMALRNAKFAKMTDTDGSSPPGGGGTDQAVFTMGNTELQKEVLDLQAYNRQLLEEKSMLKRDLESKHKENEELKDRLGHLVQDIDYDEEKKKNRFTWYGTKKKYKAGEAAKTAAEVQADLDEEGMHDMKQLDRIKEKEIKKKGPLAEAQRLEIQNLKRQIEKLQDQVKHAEEERVRLERDKARFEGETLILQKERWSDKDRLNKVEAHNELLKNQQRHAATESALTYSRAIKIPLPDKDGNTELDRLRVMVQIQEDALRRVTVQKEQLQDMLDTMEKHLPGIGDETEVQQRNLEIARLNQKLNALSAERSELDVDCKRLKAICHNLEGDNTELKKTVQHLSHNLSKAAQRDRQIKEKQASMIGHALTANEDLASQLAKLRMKNVDSLMSSHGEVKTVFAGRAKEPTSEYAIQKRLYPTVTAKRFTEHTPTITKGAMVSSVAQTDPLMVCLPHHATLEISSEETPSVMSYDSSSYAYTYIEEDLVVPQARPAGSGIQTLVGGHQGLPAALRRPGGETIPAYASPTGIPGDEYDRIARDSRMKEVASQAFRNWSTKESLVST